MMLKWTLLSWRGSSGSDVAARQSAKHQRRERRLRRRQLLMQQNANAMQPLTHGAGRHLGLHRVFRQFSRDQVMG